jgi:hypothetical protein
MHGETVKLVTVILHVASSVSLHSNAAYILCSDKYDRDCRFCYKKRDENKKKSMSKLLLSPYVSKDLCDDQNESNVK